MTQKFLSVSGLPPETNSALARLVRRFDREKTPAGWVRKGFLSSLSLLQWDEADRLQWDYGAMAGTMRRYASIRDIQELFRRMVFNILVRNTDDHPRNHGFLYSVSAWNCPRPMTSSLL